MRTHSPCSAWRRNRREGLVPLQLPKRTLLQLQTGVYGSHSTWQSHRLWVKSYIGEQPSAQFTGVLGTMFEVVPTTSTGAAMTMRSKPRTASSARLGPHPSDSLDTGQRDASRPSSGPLETRNPRGRGKELHGTEERRRPLGNAIVTKKGLPPRLRPEGTTPTLPPAPNSSQRPCVPTMTCNLSFTGTSLPHTSPLEIASLRGSSPVHARLGIAGSGSVNDSLRNSNLITESPQRRPRSQRLSMQRPMGDDRRPASALPCDASIGAKAWNHSGGEPRHAWSCV